MKSNMPEDARGAKPNINVTPLIDVLLVMLIIFMVASPLRPGRFKALVPQPPEPTSPLEPNPWTLVVTIEEDQSLKLNGMADMGSVSDMGKLSVRLSRLFQERAERRAYRYGMESRTDLPEDARIERTVFIKAPRSMQYGAVARVIDGVKGAGAEPIGLQLDDLN